MQPIRQNILFYGDSLDILRDYLDDDGLFDSFEQWAMGHAAEFIAKSLRHLHKFCTTFDQNKTAIADMKFRLCLSSIKRKIKKSCLTK